MRKTKTMKNLENGNDLDYAIRASGVSPITLESIDNRLKKMERRYLYWLSIFSISTVISTASYFYNGG